MILKKVFISRGEGGWGQVQFGKSLHFELFFKASLKKFYCKKNPVFVLFPSEKGAGDIYFVPSSPDIVLTHHNHCPIQIDISNLNMPSALIAFHKVLSIGTQFIP